MLAAAHAMSTGAQTIVYFIAYAAFVDAAILAWVQTPRTWWPTFVAVGLACMTLVLFWNAAAA